MKKDEKHEKLKKMTEMERMLELLRDISPQGGLDTSEESSNDPKGGLNDPDREDNTDEDMTSEGTLFPQVVYDPKGSPREGVTYVYETY